MPWSWLNALVVGLVAGRHTIDGIGDGRLVAAGDQVGEADRKHGGAPESGPGRVGPSLESGGTGFPGSVPGGTCLRIRVRLMPSSLAE